MGSYIPPVPQKDGSDIQRMIEDIKRRQMLNQILYHAAAILMVVLLILELLR